MTWRLIRLARAALVAAVVLFLLGGCVNPLDFPQKIDAPRYIHDPCNCGEEPCSDL